MCRPGQPLSAIRRGKCEWWAMLNRAICAARAAWYGVYESARLQCERQLERPFWGGGGPLVSVLIPTHNRADLLFTRALPSVLAQTYRNLEIIIAAHGCTDGTLR